MINKKVIIAGAGPGDLDLLTLKTKKYIETADVIVYDRLINKKLLNLAKEDAELIYIGKENTDEVKIQSRINEVLIEKVNEGKLVLRLKDGDPFIFGRGGEEANYLKENEIKFEIIPGICSVYAVPAYAGIPLTYRGISSEIHIFSGHEKEGGEKFNFELISKLDGTVIFLMAIKRLSKIIKGLIDNGKRFDTPIALIENGTKINQKIVKGTFEDIINKAQAKNINSPSIIIIGEVVLLADDLSWFIPEISKKISILVTRSKHQSFDFAENLKLRGFNVMKDPLLEIEELDFKYPNFDDYSVIIFNSYNAVKYFFKNLDDVRKLASIKIAAVGKITGKEIEKYKLKIDYDPEIYEFDKLLDLISKDKNNEKKVLIIGSNLLPINMLEIEEKYGIKSDKLAVYKILKIEKDLSSEDLDIVTFCSSLAVDSFFENFTDIKKLLTIRFASIGPTISETIRKYGYNVDIESETHTSEGLIDAIVKDL